MTLKRCVHCGEWQQEEEFAWRWKSAGIRQKACRSCRKEQNAQWYNRHKEGHVNKVRERTNTQRMTSRKFINEYLLRHPCVDCQERDPVVLEFDHVEGKKFKAISKMVAEGYSINAAR